MPNPRPLSREPKRCWPWPMGRASPRRHGRRGVAVAMPWRTWWPASTSAGWRPSSPNTGAGSPNGMAPPNRSASSTRCAEHRTVSLVLWFFAHGIMPLYTPLGGSWLNMAESIQRILGRRALAGQHPQTPAEIITWLEATARGWNRQPTPFVWGGKRQARRRRAFQRRHRLGGSGACTRRPLSRTNPPCENGYVQSK